MSSVGIPYTSFGDAPTSTSQNLDLTTVFTPPTECATPFITIPDAGCDDITCFALFMPSLEIDSATGGAHIKCLPSFATDDDFNESPIFTYSPGLFCPSGMTTGTSVSGTAICCPSGLKCTNMGRDATFYKCTATMTAGIFGEGGWGENPDIGFISSTSVLSSKFHQTIFAEATAITLLRQGAANHDDNSDGVSDTQTTSGASTSSIAMTSDPTTTQPGPNNTSSPRSSSNTAKTVGIVVGAVAGVFLILLLYFFFVRYRPRQLRKRNTDIQPGAAQETRTSGPQPYPGDSTVGFWNLKSELDPTATRAELEGTEVGGQGPGIYVMKPELEGSVGIKRLLGVFVKGKAELEGNTPGSHNGYQVTNV
ncbi:hypothetical protein F4808DRAFT_437797 [Astrocystis sublimbata]|nr:hypothetical protein F4808DRAFT_437797 [Astrocystis sublimbata]